MLYITQYKYAHKIATLKHKMITKKKIITYAKKILGFDDCRFTSPFLSHELDKYRQWLKEEKYADMSYLKKHLPFKEDPNHLLPGVKSAIVVIKNYKNTPKQYLTQTQKIARYRQGKDYHQVIGDKLKQLESYIQSQDPTVNCLSGVDSKPIAEKSLALKAGIGFRGKNTLVINPKFGSYVLIGVILTTQKFKSDLPLNQTCNECQLCIDACPGSALSENKSLDSERCLSYQSLAKKTKEPPKASAKNKGWIAGCDICQEVCPHNQNTPLTDWPEFFPFFPEV